MNNNWTWWYQHEEEFALWKKLNKLTELPKTYDDFIERRKDLFGSAKYGDICREMVKRYGNIYFFNPFPAAEGIVRDNCLYKYVHGHNSSTKSYHCAGDFSYEAIGWSPYRKISPSKYGRKILSAFSPKLDTQRSSSQLHLFSIDSKDDIGLLPRLETIEEEGGKVAWHDKRKGILHSVMLPDGTLLEFRSAEMTSKSVSASAIDYEWLDEYPPVEIHDESIARVIRKDGRLIMSFLVEAENVSRHYAVIDIYKRYEADIRNEGKSDKAFYFLTLEDNLSLDPSTLKAKKEAVSESGRIWRFSAGGRFVTEQRGIRVYPNFSPEIHEKADLLINYDPLRMLNRAYDLGKVKPACVGWQQDKWGICRFLFAIISEDIELTDFIDQIEAFCHNYMPNLYGTTEILPHDARRRSGFGTTYALSSEEIFHKKYLRNTKVLYVNRKAVFQAANDLLGRLVGGQPRLQFDQVHAAELIHCLSAYNRDEKTNEPKKDNYFEHLSDAFKLSVADIYRLLPRVTSVYEERLESVEPGGYGLLRIARTGVH